MQKQKPILGWREYVALPDFEIKSIKAKVDSGARTSAIHAEEIEYIKRGNKNFIRCIIYPLQKSKKKMVHITFPLIDKRWVKSSVGHKTLRPVVMTTLKVGEQLVPIELTLVNRDLMGFRMLLGREAIRGRFLLDTGKSYLVGKKPKKKPKKEPVKKKTVRKKK